MPKPLRPLFCPLARYGTRWFARKYALDLTKLETQRETLARGLTTQPALAAEFADLIRRRDELYAVHRGQRRKPV